MFALLIQFLSAVSLLAGIETSAQTQPLCMSDAELRAYLTEGVLFQLGFGGSECCRRDKSPVATCNKVIQQLQNLETRAVPSLRINRDRALAPFKRSFGSQADPMFKLYSDRLETKLKERVKKFDTHQCSVWLHAIEGYYYLEEESLRDMVLNRFVTSVEFAAERQQMPKCR